jgi:hypothetical protein
MSARFQMSSALLAWPLAFTRSVAALRSAAVRSEIAPAEGLAYGRSILVAIGRLRTHRREMFRMLIADRLEFPR